MKSILRAVLLFATLSCGSAFASNWACDYYLPQCPEKSNTYAKLTASIIDKAISSKSSVLDAMKSVIEITEQMYPKDKTLNDIAKQQYAVLKFATDSNLSKEEKNNLIQTNSALLEEVIKDRFQMANAFIEAGKQVEAQRGSQNPGNVAAVATMLNGVGKAFNNSFGQSITPPPQVCNYYGGTRYCF